jgi:4-amino-4-deoxy-L-arabinose transferase-like glycosyltransferase
LLGLIGATAILYGLGLGSLDLWAPDEPRYAAIAEELRSFRHGLEGLVLLHLNDTAYTQKPPLYFWLAALFGAPFGRVTEFAARLPSAIAGVVCVALTAWIGRMLLGRGATALLAAGLLATSFRFAFTARRAQLDVLLTAFELGAIALFLVLETRRSGIEEARRSPLVIAGLHAALGAAALVKGPVGWLPLGVFAGYLAWQGRGRAFRAIGPWWSWILSIGPLAIWAAAAIALAPPGFAETAIAENLLGRFFAGTSHARPFYYYLYQLPLDFLPWTLVLPFGLTLVWHAAHARMPQQKTSPLARSSARFLLVWAALPILFFSLSAGKRGVYLLPIFPALALISSLLVRRTPCRRPRWLCKRRLAAAIATFAVIEMLLVLVALPRLDDLKSPRSIAIAAATHSEAGEPIGVFGLKPIEGVLAYYAGCRVASLGDEQALRSFLEAGGRIVLLRERDLISLDPRLGLKELEGFRSGRRRLVLAVATDPEIPEGQSRPH